MADHRDETAALDRADALLEQGAFSKARAAYREILLEEPEHPRVTPSVLYLEWANKPTSAGRLVLERYADLHPGNTRARALSERATPWVGWLPPPRESTLSMFPQLEGKPHIASGMVKLTLSHLESPSSQLAMRRFLRPYGGQLALGVQEIPPPDARILSRHARWPLWRWNGIEATPALGAPTDPRVSEIIAIVASWPFQAPRYRIEGAALALQRGLQPTFENIEQLLRAALHPPEAPAGTRGWQWAHRVLHVVALLLAGFEGWEGTVHRDALLSMAAVRNDWTTEAAVTALADRSRAEPALRAEIQPLLLSLMRDGPAAGYWSVGWPVTAALWRLGQQEDEELRHALASHLQSYEDSPQEQTRG